MTHAVLRLLWNTLCTMFGFSAPAVAGTQDLSDVFRAVMHLLWNDRHEGTREAAAHALGTLGRAVPLVVGEAEAVDCLVDALCDKFAKVSPLPFPTPLHQHTCVGITSFIFFLFHGLGCLRIPFHSWMCSL